MDIKTLRRLTKSRDDELYHAFWNFSGCPHNFGLTSYCEEVKCGEMDGCASCWDKAIWGDIKKER